MLIRDLHLLTMKPVLYAANVSEAEVADTDGNPYVQKVREYAALEGAEVVPISAKVESEIAELEGEDKQMFLEELGLAESGLNRLIRAAYRLLGLYTYFTAGVQEVRAWTIRKGMKAPQAAGVIHTDFERGFIRAEVVGYDDLIGSGSMNAAKEKRFAAPRGQRICRSRRRRHALPFQRLARLRDGPSACSLGARKREDQRWSA